MREGRIEAITPQSECSQTYTKIDLAGGLLAPGFIDTQVNGGGGIADPGHIAPGHRANFALLDDQFHVRTTWIN